MREIPWRAIVFDLDDTLYPELEYVHSGFREVAKWCASSLNLEATSVYQELAGLFDSGFRKNTFDTWVERRGLRGGWVEKMVATYRNHIPQINPFLGAREMLLELRGEFRLGLLSDGDLAVQNRKLAALGVRELFDAVVFSDSWGRESWKPSRRPYVAILDALKVNPREAVYVGDNPAKDFIACRQLGMWSVWLRQQSGIYAVLSSESPEGAPDYIVCTLTDLRELLTDSKSVGTANGCVADDHHLEMN